MRPSKPTQVRIAVGLFYLALLLSLAKPFLEPGLWLRPPAILIAGSAAAALLTVFLIEFVSIGRNWARIAYLVLTLLSLPIGALLLKAELSAPNLGTASVAVQWLAHAIGLYLLFTAPGKGWFAPRG